MHSECDNYTTTPTYPPDQYGLQPYHQHTHHHAARHHKCPDCDGEFDLSVPRTVDELKEGKSMCPFCGNIKNKKRKGR